MAKIRPKDGVALPSVANPAAEDAVRRDWIEQNTSSELDGGRADSIYTAAQKVDGGGA